LAAIVLPVACRALSAPLACLLCSRQCCGYIALFLVSRVGVRLSAGCCTAIVCLGLLP
jgi:hypothetical protein